MFPVFLHALVLRLDVHTLSPDEAAEGGRPGMLPPLDGPGGRVLKGPVVGDREVVGFG